MKRVLNIITLLLSLVLLFSGCSDVNFDNEPVVLSSIDSFENSSSAPEEESSSEVEESSSAPEESSSEPTAPPVSSIPVIDNPPPSLPPQTGPITPDGSKVCYLTFDDGPSDNTLLILDILEEYDVKATFFVIGAAKTEYLPMIAEKGHAIGVHSWSHNYAIYRSVDSFFSDFQKISDEISGKTGITPEIMRFPGGSSNTISKSYCVGIMRTLTNEVVNRGYSYFDWNVSSGDATTGYVPKERIVNNVLNGAKNKKTICVLMHDTAAKTTTVEALPEIIEGLIYQGFVFEVLTKDSYGFRHGVNN